MASLSLLGKGVANGGGGEEGDGGSREGKQPLERFNCSDNRLGFKKKSLTQVASPQHSYLKAEKLNCSFGKQLLERKTSQQVAIPSPATLIQWPQPELSHPPSSPAKAGWSRAD